MEDLAESCGNLSRFRRIDHGEKYGRKNTKPKGEVPSL
jgi:hypothetical protein